MTTVLDRHHTHSTDDTTSVTSISEEPSMSQSQEDKLVEHRPITTDITTTTTTTNTAETTNAGTVLGDNGITTLPDVERGIRREEEWEDHPLAVAVPVSKDDTNRRGKNIPKAESYDTSTKHENNGRRRCCFYGWMICCCAVLLLCAVGIPVGIIVSRNSSSSSNLDQLPHPRETVGIRERMEQLVGPEKLLQSPYERALQWITFDDPLQLTPDNENLEQRYILAYLYFATTKARDWKSCNPPSPPLPQADVSSSSSSSSDNSGCTYSKLISVNTENKGQFVPTFANRWLSNRHECSWAQVKCNESNQVIAIELDGQGLNGVFPIGIIHLPFLETIGMKFNKIRGSIPAEIATLERLTDLDLSFNSITGNIPEELWGMTNLNMLSLGHNRLRGGVPTQVGQLVSLHTLSLSNNHLMGELPSDIVKLQKLTDLRLASVGMHGRIPMELGQLSNLRFLRLNDNDFSGKIPSEIGDFEDLILLHLAGNPLLKDDFPTKIWGRKCIKVIDIRDCDFSGSIGSRVGEMPQLQDLWLSGNPFTGTIPTELSNVRQLRSLLIENTSIEGPMPIEVCKKTGWSNVETWADCLGDQPEFECSCCTTCCHSDGKGCLPVGL